MARGLRSSAARWIGVVVLTAALTGAFTMLRLAAALLIGAMAASIIFAVMDRGVKVPQRLFFAAQAILGCMIARALVPSILHAMIGNWPLFVGAVLYVVGAACVLGILLTRWRVLPGTAALWGSFPGAATAMVIMSEAYGADIRLVAFMQYLRVVIVALVASGVARIYVAGSAPIAVDWLRPVQAIPLVQTLAIAAVGAVLGLSLKIPAGPLLVPMVLATGLQGAAGVTIELPPLLLAVTYSIVGWAIGQRFTREILVYAAQALPRVAGSIFALVAACAVFAAALVAFAGIDPMTAYLATSPGGADSVAIIAASTNVDVPFVMALQISRFLFVLIFGPSIARFVAARMTPRGLSETAEVPRTG